MADFDKWHLVVPFASACVYAFASILMKRCLDLGVGVWRSTFVANQFTALLFLAYAFMHGLSFSFESVWIGFLLGVSILGAFLFMYMALSRGDVSVAVPIMGVKILLVAVLNTWLYGQSLGWDLWVASALATIAIGLDLLEKKERSKVGFTVVLTIISCIFFAMMETGLQYAAPRYGFAEVGAVQFATLSIASFFLMPFFKAPLRELPQESLKWLVPAALLMALQSLGISATIGLYGDATSVNVVYSTRGIIGVMMVWWLGHYFANHERESAGKGVFRKRIVSALLLSVAVVLVIT